MSIRSSMGLSRYQSGEKDVFVATPANWNGGVRGVIYCHGRNDDATTVRSFASIGELHLVNALADARFLVLGIDAGGTLTYGNATAMTAVGNAVSYLQGTLGAKSGKVILIGASMGTFVSLNYAKANPSKVAAVVTVNTALDLNDLVTNNRGGLASEVNTAYGGTYSEATNGPTCNPANYAASLSALPIRMHYSTDDPYTLQATFTAFASVSGATAVSVGALGHTQAAVDAAPRDQIISFLSQYA